MTKLSKRLEAVASFVPKGCYLADVGSDHALLPIALLERGLIEEAQAIDNKMAPYLRMRRNVEEVGLGSKIHCSNSNGLDDLSEGVDTIAICGVGGLLTCDILYKDVKKLENINTIILDPHRDIKTVREKVSKLGYHLVDEEMIYESRIYYSVMKWEKGAPSFPYSENELLFGPINMKKRSETFIHYLEEQKEKIENLLKDNLPAENREYYSQLLNRINSQLD